MFQRGEIVIASHVPAWTSDERLHSTSGHLVALTSFQDGLSPWSVETSTRYLNHEKITIDIIKMRWYFLHADLGIIAVSLSPRKGQEERVRLWFASTLITSPNSTDSSAG